MHPRRAQGVKMILTGASRSQQEPRHTLFRPGLPRRYNRVVQICPLYRICKPGRLPRRTRPIFHPAAGTSEEKPRCANWSALAVLWYYGGAGFLDGLAMLMHRRVEYFEGGGGVARHMSREEGTSSWVKVGPARACFNVPIKRTPDSPAGCRKYLGNMTLVDRKTRRRPRGANTSTRSANKIEDI